MYTKTLTADGYSTCIEVPIGGNAEFRVTYNSGTGTTSLLRAPKGVARTEAAGYVEFATTTTVTDSAALGVQLSEGFYCFEVSSGSSPNITVELASADSNHVTIKDSEKQVA